MGIPIAVIDYGMGNIHSACKGLEFNGGQPLVTDNSEEILRSAAVVLPGVGSFDPAMRQLRSRDLVEPIKQFIATGKPFLGICLGLQLLFESSEEGNESGLGILRGEVRRFQSQPGLTIPHMGWNSLEFTQSEHPLWQNIHAATAYVYFVHSYYVEPNNQTITSARVTHGTQQVTAAVAQDNIMAVQFHPEKSSTTGLKILANFIKLAKQE
jgi:imidazole glycerol-phosphate synthase subunit HisH